MWRRRSAWPYQPSTLIRCQAVAGSASCSSKLGRRAPLTRGRPSVPGIRGGAGSYRRASSRSREIMHRCRPTSRKSSIAEKLLSPTAITRRPGSQRAVLEQRLPGPVGQLLVPPAVLAAPVLGGREHGQDGQRPHATSPGYGSEQHHAEPAQAAGFDEVAMAGPNRIPINPARLDFGPPAPLDGVVEANHDRSRRHEGSNEEQQEAVRDGAGGPAPCAEHPVVDGEPRPLVETHDTQRRRDRPPTRGEQGPCDQDQNVAPDCGGEGGRKGLQPRGQHRGHARRHGTGLPLSGCSAAAHGHLEKFIHAEATPNVFKGLVTVESSFRGIFRGALMSEEVVPMAGVDAMRERIAAPPWPRGGVAVTRANRGYTLYSRRTGGPVARLRPTGKADNVQVLWWCREAWATPGDFGPLILPLDKALDFVATEGFFWINA